MQMTRRFLSMILAVAMICGMLTGITISASAVSVSGSFVKYTAEADGTIAEGDCRSQRLHADLRGQDHDEVRL